MEKKKFLDKSGAEVIAGKINLLATVVDGLMELDHIKVITEAEINHTPTDKLEPNVQYNIAGKSVDYDFGTIWVHNNITGENSFLPSDNPDLLMSDIYTPIGIVVIPASHNVYGDGSCGVMALKSARASTPDTGGEEELISWGEYGTLDLPELPNLTTAPSLKWEPSFWPERPRQTSETGYLCVDFGTAVVNPSDSHRKWCVKNGTHIGSPFNDDGSKNTAYFKGATNDFDGEGNTDKFKTGHGPFAAIEAVAAYDGIWYMPATGELGYVAANRDLLNAKLVGAGQHKIESQKHWTSSKFDKSNLRCIDMSNGQVAYAGGNSANLVRPFRKASGTATVGQFWTGTEFKDTYDSTCIGIVVIPTSHDVYGDGSCGVMALQYATPTGPGAAVGIKAFEYNASEHSGEFVPDSIGTPSTVRCIGIDYGPNINHSELDTPEETTYVPSNEFPGPPSADGETKYEDHVGPFAPSPYTLSGAKNELFPSQCLADFNGKTNTEAILSHVTVENWQTADAINNPTISNGGAQSMPIGEFPAACCCWRYHPVGTNQGDWYLPAAGELAYVCARQGEINNIMFELNRWNPGSAILVAPKWHWSSSEFSAWDARAVSFHEGLVGSAPRSNQGHVRPFIRVTV